MDNLEDLSIEYFNYLAILIVLVGVTYLVVPQFRSKLDYMKTLLANFRLKIMSYTPITYLEDDVLSPVSKRRLRIVQRKILVLDMDETLLSAILQYPHRRHKVLPAISADFEFFIPRRQTTVFIYKRPHVDLFLDCVSKWYDIVVFTAATESYATRALDYLDAGRNILNNRLYRQHCDNFCGLRAKYVTAVHSDLANILLLDDSDISNCFNLGNCIKIKPFKRGTPDDQLLRMLPFLDALRFTMDVRSILGRTTRIDLYVLPKYFKSFEYLRRHNADVDYLEEELEECCEEEQENLSNHDSDLDFEVEESYQDFEASSDGYYYE